ncbi:MAG: sigma-70 family RNA polymerase sigma factor [Flavobacteriales bacterium]|nr:sigma-70 family RNA polymerase sigma factor [Flavobacteriales bacterium]
MFLRRKPIAVHTDEDLVRLLREGHRSALGDLWDRYAELLYGVGMKYLKDTERSKDEVVELFAGLKDLVVRHDIERFRPWVHTVMRNRCLQVLRKHQRTDDITADLHMEDTDDDRALHEATLQQLENAITRLNSDQQVCIRLFHLQRASYEQVAARTGHSIEQVRSHLQNGRRNLRIILQRPPHHAQRHA